ncbi:MAG: ABC transporter substrate-binding protein, partial [Xanthobacteraceae bacterium]
MRRREFIALLGGAAAVGWPRAARAQQGERVRRIGALIPRAVNDPESVARIAAFAQVLQQLGWAEGRNLRIDTVWAGGSVEAIRKHAAELVADAPDVILAHGGTTVGPLLIVTSALPIVFVSVTDPVGAGFVENLARPGGNATGFTLLEFSLSGKWLELLKEIAPGASRVAVLRDTSNPSQTAQYGAIQAVAPSLRVEVTPVNMRDASEIERAVASIARSPGGGLIVTAGAAAVRHRDLIVTLAAR